MPRAAQHPENVEELLPENPEQTTRLLRRWLRLWRRLLLELRRWRRRRTLRLLRLRRALLRRRRHSWRIGLYADDGRVGGFAIGQPDIVDRMLHPMQARACRKHPT